MNILYFTICCYYYNFKNHAFIYLTFLWQKTLIQFKQYENWMITNQFKHFRNVMLKVNVIFVYYIIALILCQNFCFITIMKKVKYNYLNVRTQNNR